MNTRLRPSLPTRLRRQVSLLLFVLCGLAGTQMFAQAALQTASRVAGPIDASVRHTFQGSVPAQVRSLADTGRASASLPMKDMFLLLQGSAEQAGALEKTMEDLHNPNSPNYRQWLTPAEFGARFGATDKEVETVSAWLQAGGFSVTAIARGKNWIRFSGSAQQVEQAFGTEIHRFGASAQSNYANTVELSIPTALTPVVAGVVSLNSFLKPGQHTHSSTVTRNANGRLQRESAATVTPGTAAPLFTSTGSPEQTFLAPGDFARIYNTLPLVSTGNDGTGVPIAIVGRSDINLSDVEAFRKVFGLPFNDPTIVYPGIDPGNSQGGDEEEGALDVEWSGAVAPNSPILYVVGASTNTTDGVDISAAYIVDNVLAPIMSVSYGACEAAISPIELAFYNTMWQQAAAEGITVFVSSGDSGSDACVRNSQFIVPTKMAVSGLASTAYNVAVGGTEFIDTNPDTYWNLGLNADLSSAKGYMPEAVWNESCNLNMPSGIGNCYFNTGNGDQGAGGGGPSNCATHTSSTANLLSGLYPCGVGYKKPSWQAGLGVPADGVRDIPDVSLAAAASHDGFLLCVEGSCQWTTNANGSYSLTNATIIGGTSASSPAMAGIMALVEQKNGKFQGQANYQFYQLASQQAAGLNCDSSAAVDPAQSNGCVFHDVTAGTNAIVCTATGYGDCTVTVPGYNFSFFTGYAATPGYDPATGLGSVNAVNLVNAWGNLQLAASTTALTVSPTSFAHGSAATLNATVASATGVPSGTVSFNAGGTGIATTSMAAGQLNAGAYSVSLKTLIGGTYSLTAAYGGDASHSPSASAPVQMTVTPEPTGIAASILGYSHFYILGNASIIPITNTTLGSQYFLQVNLTNTSGYGIPTGTVTFTQGTQTVGSFPLVNGSVNLTCGPNTPCDFALGKYTYQANYSGDGSFKPVSFTFAPFTINQGKANYEVLLNTQTPPAGATIEATVYFGYDPAVLPTGLVTLTRSDTGAVLGRGNIGSEGYALITFPAPAGTYDVLGSWPGDANYQPGFLAEYEQVITTGTGTTPSTTLMTSAITSTTLGRSTPYSIDVLPSASSAGAPLPTGTITLYSGGGPIANPVPLVGGHVSTFFAWDTAGVYPIYATYSGDANYTGSSSAAVTTTVARGTPALSLQPRTNYVAIGAQASLTGKLNAPLTAANQAPPTGTIQFYDSLNGSAAQPVGPPQTIATGNGGTIVATLAPVLAAGTHTLTAIYSGDPNWNTATAPATTITVTTPDFSFTAAPGPLVITAGQSATVALASQSILGYSTAIGISCAAPLPAGMSCNTAQLQPGNTGSITVSSIAPGTVMASVAAPRSGWLAAQQGAVLAVLLLFVIPARSRRRLSTIACLLVLVAGMTFTGCGGPTQTAQATSLALTSSNSKVASGGTVVLSATVNGSRNPTGTVTFYEGTTVLGAPANIVNGVASLSLSTLSVGTHALTATYAGDSGNLQSKSANILDQTVTGQFNLTLVANSGASTHSAIVPAVLQ